MIRNGSGVRQLLLYRQAVDPEKSEAVAVDVMAVVEGQVLDVRCSICEECRTWVPGEEQMKRLIRQIEKMHGIILLTT